MSDDAPAAPVVLEGEVVAPPTAPRVDKPWLFRPGDPRINRTGRKDGSKNILRQAFVRDLTKWHAKHGYKALEKVGREKPEELFRIMAAMVPRENHVELEHTGSVAVGVVDIQEITRRTRELLARIGDEDNPRLSEE